MYNLHLVSLSYYLNLSHIDKENKKEFGFDTLIEIKIILRIINPSYRSSINFWT